MCFLARATHLSAFIGLAAKLKRTRSANAIWPHIGRPTPERPALSGDPPNSNQTAPSTAGNSLTIELGFMCNCRQFTAN
jgi:hypothetical protein